MNIFNLKRMKRGEKWGRKKSSKKKKERGVPSGSHLCQPGAKPQHRTQSQTAHTPVAAPFPVILIYPASQMRRPGIPGPLHPWEADSLPNQRPLCLPGHTCATWEQSPSAGPDLTQPTPQLQLDSPGSEDQRIAGWQAHRKERLQSETRRPDNTRDT